ncbi:hypothetical protein C8R48DRAFT_694104 [Suillus tomentosus]|nr:hypothetical protein C8R48DRAFT_694104 [Suillus tomentosus]
MEDYHGLSTTRLRPRRLSYRIIFGTIRMLFSFWYFWFGLGTLSSYLIPIAWVVLLLLSFTNSLSLIILSDFFTLDYIYCFFPHSWLK